MSESERAQQSNEIATASATSMIKAVAAAELTWSSTCVIIETALAIEVAAVVLMDGTPRNKLAFATELMNAITKAAHIRVSSLIRGEPDDAE